MSDEKYGLPNEIEPELDFNQLKLESEIKKDKVIMPSDFYMDNFIEENKELMEDLAGNPPELIPTPAEAENVMVDKELANGHILDNHAAFCHMYFPKLMQALNTLNTKALRRVIELAIKHPIGDSEKKFQSQTERDAFNILNQLLTSKYSMIIYSGMEEMERQNQEKLRNESIIKTNGEENGKET